MTFQSLLTKYRKEKSNSTNNPNDWAKEVANPSYILDRC